MKYNLPIPEKESQDYKLGLAKAYSKTFNLLTEAITILETTEEYTENNYAKIIIKNFLNKLK